MLQNIPGLLIAIEGIDGAGKSTLAKKLGDLLAPLPYPVVVTKEPGGTGLGIFLRTLLQEQTEPLAPKAECLLFMADRAQHFHQVVIPALHTGSIVISDRMGDSSLAYQSYARGHDQTLISLLNAWTMHTISPEITFYLRIPITQAYERIAKRNEKQSAFEREHQAFMHKVAEGFEALYATRSDVFILDALQDADELAQIAYTHIITLIHKKRTE